MTSDVSWVRRPRRTLRAGTFELALGGQTYVMGIINMTPDSFSADGCWTKTRSFSDGPKGGRDAADLALRQARRMVREGAHILDVGGESSRPGALPVSAAEEMRRVIPVIERLTAECRVPVSVDTYKPSVARAAFKAGAVFLNNIRGAQADLSLLKTAAQAGAAVILMHMRGMPRRMQKDIHYRDLMAEITAELKAAVKAARQAGISAESLVIDPGIGFGKTADHNLQILKHLDVFQSLSCPVLIGASRKSFIGEILKRPVGQRVFGGAAVAVLAAAKGADIVRVHDVKPMAECLRMTDAVLNSSAP